MLNIREWVTQNHYGTIKELSKNSEVGIRTLHRWLNEEKSFVDDEGNVYKK